MREPGSGSRAYSSRAFEGEGETLSSQFPPSFADIASGADQAGVRLYNERLLLSLVRRFGPLSKIEVAKLTGLSVQSTSAIMNRLRADGLLKREAPLRGRVGQPTIPMSLDPEGAYSLGLKIGRRSCDLVLIDFRGAVRRRAHRTFAFPTPAMILDFVRASLPALVEPLNDAQRRRIAGLGIASPFQLWNWEAEIGAPAGAMAEWRDFDTAGEIASISPYPVTLCNDATAACAAEFFFGRGWRYRDFLCFFIGAFIGGGLVLDGALRPGRTGNAGALGSMPVMPKSEGGVAPQLIACASICQLERRLEGAGIDASSMWATPDAWADFGSSSRRLGRGRGLGSGPCLGRRDLHHRFRGDRRRRSDACARARSTDRADGANFRRSRPARIERRRDRFRDGRRRCARNRRRRPAADQEFRSRPGGPPEGRDQPGRLTPGSAASRREARIEPFGVSRRRERGCAAHDDRFRQPY